MLPSGQLFIAGGNGASGALRSAEIYDPASNKLTVVANQMTQGRGGCAAALITTGASAGKVLLVGGHGDASNDGGDQSLDTAEIFDPGADPVHGTFTALTAHMNATRTSPGLAPLPQGGFLIAGGYQQGGPTYLDDAETLDPAMTAFTPTANKMSAPREFGFAVPLANGQIFVAGGNYAITPGHLSNTDLFDPSTRTFTTVPFPVKRGVPGFTLLRSGRVLVVGGVGDNGFLPDAIVFDPDTKAFLTTPGTMAIPRGLPSATPMYDGRVLIVGGQGTVIVGAIDIFAE
jgi:hypothetical protein